MESEYHDVEEEWIVLGILHCNIWKARIAKTKQAAEAMAKDYHDNFGLADACCFRNFTVLGADSVKRALHLSGDE